MVNEIEQRKEKLKNFFTEKYNWLVYIALAFVVFIATFIRTRNIPGLRDITTGGWTLAQDLDPYLFLRWGKEIVAHGALPAIDTMRYIPLGFNTTVELILPSYFIAWFHEVAVYFGSTSVEQSAVLLPVFMFALTVIAFFFLVRKMFIDGSGELKAGIIALISSFFLSVIPALLPRTIAGIPEKEASGFLFLFLAYYFFLSAWKSEKYGKRTIFALLAGISTAIMALTWGGFIFIYLVIAFSGIVALILRQANKENIFVYTIWIISSFLIMNQFSVRYDLLTMLTSTTTLIPISIFGLLIIHLVLTETRLKKYISKYEFLNEIPEPVITLAVTTILGVVFATLFFGPHYITDKISDLTHPLITPVTDRLGVTVAENRQPYFSEWAGSFGPLIGNTPIFFWLFVFGSIYLYASMMKVLGKKERILATIGYSFFIIASIFSRYSPSSIMNGTNVQSLAFYISGALVLAFTLARPAMFLTKAKKIYDQTAITILILGLLAIFFPSLLGWIVYKIILSIALIAFGFLSLYGISKQEALKNIDFGIIMLFSLFFLSIISARGSVRTIMVLVPAASVTATYLMVSLFNDSKKINENYRLFAWIVTLIVGFSLLFAGYQFYQQSIYLSESNVKIPLPGHQMSLDMIYYQQWQKAMAWVREYTPKDAVFAHWWDYGYWVQTIGERATVLDGGNVYPYWNYLMGRYALTGTDEQAALQLLYSHNVTHFLIDSSDIGKYPAFSSIGSNDNYDRYSFLNAFVRSDQETIETKDSIKYAYYPGQKGTLLPLESDLKYNNNGTEIILPAGKAGIIGIIVEKNSTSLMQPRAVLYYQNNQYILPMRYAYSEKLIDFGSGLNSGIFLFPIATQTSVSQDAALIYLSDRTVNSQLARLYLYNQNDSYFKLVHSEDDEIVSQLKASGALKSDFVYFSGIRGPIKIWQVSYPEGMQVNPEYLRTDFPDSKLAVSK